MRQKMLADFFKEGIQGKTCLKMKKAAEKRLYPRIKRKLPIQVAANGYDFVTTTKNVSCLGVYCHIKKYVPPFTKVLIKLSLPISVSKVNKNFNINCKGVVVRTEDEKKGNGFNVAIFFNEISEAHRKKINCYLSQFLPYNG